MKDIILLKLSSSGEILWRKRIGTEKDELGTAIAIGSNHVYITGITRGNLFGEYRNEKWGGYEGVLAKYDLNGNLVLGKQFSGGENLEAIAVDSQSNICAAGTTEDEATNEVVLFLAKFNSDGNLIWRRVFPYEDEIIISISVDKSSNVYMAGNVAIYSDEDESKAIPIPDAFISKYRGENGERVWSKRIKSQEEEKGRGSMMLQ